jgi:putative SOS response-associated peptidase YedK
MCGRFTLHTPVSELQMAFKGFAFPPDVDAHYNIAPSLSILTIENDGERKVAAAKWGLVPFWAKDPKIGNRMINARADTLATKPAFRDAYQNKRCLIIADGFFEWKKSPDGKTKTPMYITLNEGRPFAFAGLWDTWKQEDGERLKTCTIITTEPNALMADIHNRMPVILPPDSYDLWLDPDTTEPEILNGLLHPYPAEDMTLHPVSDTVNSPRNDETACIEPVTLEPPQPEAEQLSLL